ncbi:MAG: hypothetical protein ACI837_001251 [Crocinitomicaceae bacterium]|jgi:hypothetical protein
MSNPSFSNIDLWLFELAEGNLSPTQAEQLELFLLQHPELDVERDMWEAAKVENVAMVYPGAASLERKRKPATIYVGSILLLLLIGSVSYGIWNEVVSADQKAKTLAQQQLYTHDRLQQEISDLQDQVAKNESDKIGGNSETDQIGFNQGQSKAGQLNLSIAELVKLRLKNGFGAQMDRADGNGNESNSSIDFVAWNRGAATRLNALQPQSNSGIQVAQQNTQNAQNQNVARNNATPQEPNSNLVNSSLANSSVANSSVANSSVANSNLADSNVIEFTSTEIEDSRLYPEMVVWEEKFITRAATEIDFNADDHWKLRAPSEASSGGGSGAQSTSFKKKLKNMSRALKRMMDNPIALKNSRDPHFHVPGMTANDINFSSAGTLIATRVQAMSRIQWLGKENEQMINELAIDGYSYDIRGGWGVQLNHSMYKSGGIHLAQAAFTYSPKISVSNWVSVEPSVRFKMGNKLLQADKMEGVTQVELDRGIAHDFYSGDDNPIGRNLWYKDVGVGLLVNTKWFFIGAQVDNLFKYKDNIYSNDWEAPRRAANHFVATIGTDWLSRTGDLGLSPYVVYQRNDEFSEIWGGVNFKWKAFNLGIATTENLDPAASIGMKFDNFSLHYNADYTTSSMTGERALSHQVTFRLQANKSPLGRRLFKM